MQIAPPETYFGRSIGGHAIKHNPPQSISVRKQASPKFIRGLAPGGGEQARYVDLFQVLLLGPCRATTNHTPTSGFKCITCLFHGSLSLFGSTEIPGTWLLFVSSVCIICITCTQIPIMYELAPLGCHYSLPPQALAFSTDQMEKTRSECIEDCVLAIMQRRSSNSMCTSFSHADRIHRLLALTGHLIIICRHKLMTVVSATKRCYHLQSQNFGFGPSPPDGTTWLETHSWVAARLSGFRLSLCSSIPITPG